MKCQPASTASVVSISMAGLEAPVSQYSIRYVPLPVAPMRIRELSFADGNDARPSVLEVAPPASENQPWSTTWSCVAISSGRMSRVACPAVTACFRPAFRTSCCAIAPQAPVCRCHSEDVSVLVDKDSHVSAKPVATACAGRYEGSSYNPVTIMSAMSRMSTTLS